MALRAAGHGFGILPPVLDLPVLIDMRGKPCGIGIEFTPIP
jgi:hypothetical protein